MKRPVAERGILSGLPAPIKDLTDVAGVPAAGVNAVVLNVTAVNATVGGYLTVFPTGSGRPLASAAP